MPLVPSPDRLSKETLEQLRKEMRDELQELRSSIDHPVGAVLLPTGLMTAAELADSAIALLDRPGDRSIEALAAEVNLGYASLLAGLDLVKSHTNAPIVPAPRSRRPGL